MHGKLVAPLALALLATGAALSAQAASTANLQAQARIDMQHARTIALKTCPGHIVKQELEQEPGGSDLRYSFDIAAANVTHEVGVAGKTGKVLESSIEGADND